MQQLATAAGDATGRLAPAAGMVIHVGLPKTASTFLQHHVFPALPAPFVYLSGERHWALRMVQAREGFDALRFRQWVESEAAAASTEKPAALTVLSHEHLSGDGFGSPEVDPEVIASNLAAAFPGARILLVVRSQFDYVRSLYTFRVAIRGYDSRSLDGFVREEGARGMFAMLEYDRLVRVFQSRFGAENVLVLPFELLQRDEPGFLRSVCGFIGLSVPSLPAARRVNQSTKKRAIVTVWRVGNWVLRRLLNGLARVGLGGAPALRLRRRYRSLKVRTTDRLNQMLRGAAELSIDDSPAFREMLPRYARSNRRLQSMLPRSIDLAALGYPVASVDEDVRP